MHLRDDRVGKSWVHDLRYLLPSGKAEMTASQPDSGGSLINRPDESGMVPWWESFDGH